MTSIRGDWGEKGKGRIIVKHLSVCLALFQLFIALRVHVIQMECIREFSWGRWGEKARKMHLQLKSQDSSDSC